MHKEVTYRKLSEIDLGQIVNDMSLKMSKAGNLDKNAGGKFFNYCEQPSPRGIQIHYNKEKETIVWK